MSGSLIGGVSRGKTGWLADSMADLQLGIDGLRSQISAPTDGDRFARAVGAFARTCSVFLRKTILGDRGRRETRLLDDQILESIGLRFDRLRKIPRADRREIEVGFQIRRGTVQITRRDDDTLEPREAWCLHAGPHELRLSIEWPLPGAAGWAGVPSDEAPWLVSAAQLFDTGGGSGLSCDQWLGQQLVLFDDQGISLKEMIQTVANFEGAHSMDVGRLGTFEGEAVSRAAKNPALHILNAVSMCGIRYGHLIVIECALYLYEKLLEERSIDRPCDGIYRVSLGVECSPEQAESDRPDWVQFHGGMILSFFNHPKVIRHQIRAVT